MAASNGHKAMAQQLLKKGPDIAVKDRDDWTALHVAASNGRVATVQLLLEKQTNVEAKNRDDRTALHVSASNGHEGTVRLLLENGANVEAKDGDDRPAIPPDFREASVEAVVSAAAHFKRGSRIALTRQFSGWKLTRASNVR